MDWPHVNSPMPCHGDNPLSRLLNFSGMKCPDSPMEHEMLCQSNGACKKQALPRQWVPLHRRFGGPRCSFLAIPRTALCLALLAMALWIGLALAAHAQPTGPLGGPNAGALIGGGLGASGLGDADLTVADGIVDRFKVILQNIEKTAGERARQLLYLLFAIDLVISIGRGIHMQEDLGAMMSRFVFRLGFVTIISLFIGHASEFVDWIAAVAVTLGQEASGREAVSSLSISAIFGQGWQFAGEMIGEIKFWKPLSIFYIVTAFFILLITGIMMALLLTVHIEMFVVALGGLIVLGFAGLETTKDSATAYFKTLIGKGFKLMGLLMIFAMMNKITIEVAGAGTYSLGLELVLTIMILQLVTVVLMLTVPSSLENLAGGIGASRAAEVIAGVAVAFAAAPLAKAAIGASVGGAAGGIGGMVSGVRGAVGGGAGAMVAGALKGAGGGAMQSAARYGGAGAMPGHSLRGTLAKDLKQMLGSGKNSNP